MPRKKETISAKRRKTIAELYLKGYNQYDIGEKIGITQGAVSKALVVVRKQWQESATEDIKELTLRELAKIDKLEQTYWDAWHKSCLDHQEKTIKAIKKKSRKKDADLESKKPDSVEQTTKEIKAFGNPSFLAGIQRCVEMRCKLLGIDIQKIETKAVDKFTRYDDDELDSKIKELDSI